MANDADRMVDARALGVRAVVADDDSDARARAVVDVSDARG